MERDVRIFNASGIAQFAEILDRTRTGEKNVHIPEDLLSNDMWSEVADGYVVEPRLPEGKYEAVSYLCGQMNMKDDRELYYNIGLWTWLSALYFDQVCPLRPDGTRKSGDNARHILSDPKNWKRYYRHLLACPCRLYNELGEPSKVLLHGVIEKHGDMVEQLAAYQEIGTNPGLVDAVNILYWNTEKRKLKKGAASKASGSVRRFVHVIRQYQLTYDLNSMGGKEIVTLLPQEFTRWTK